MQDDLVCVHCGKNPGHNDVAVECYECDERWAPYEEGDRVGWTMSDGGQDDGTYTVIDVTYRDLIIKNQHGLTFHAKHHQMWILDEA